MDNGERSGRATEPKAILEVMEPGEPYTSREIADELGCARTTAYKKLQDLCESDILDTKKVGARARVWWLRPTVKARTPSSRSDSFDQDDEYEELLASERQFRAVFEEAFDAILIVGDDSQYVEANPAACELFGLSRTELLGHTIADFAADGYDFEQAWQDFQGSDLDRGLFPLVRADGEQRIVEFAATPNILPGRHLSVIRDVTERQETTQELERERERSRQYQRTLAADTVIQLEMRMEGDFFLDELSAQLDCSCEYEGAASTSTDRLLEYVTVSGGRSEAISAMATSSSLIERCRIIHESDTGTAIEFEMDRSPMQALVKAGANVRSMRSESGTTTAVAEIGADMDLQRFISEVTSTCATADVVTKRILDRPIVTTRQYRDSLVSRLTERQTEVLRAAYLSGYFEWPRNTDAETIASSMEIASSTWLRHLRLAEAKIVSWFFQELEV